ETIGYPTTGILVESVEEIFDRAEESDRRDGCAECLEIPGEKAAPEILAEREQEHRRRYGDDVAFQAKESNEAVAPRGHAITSCAGCWSHRAPSEALGRL